MESNGEAKALPNVVPLHKPESKNTPPQFNPQKYLAFVRERYHQKDQVEDSTHGYEFKGQRTPEQRDIAEYLSLEADDLFDSIKALGTSMNRGKYAHNDPDNPLGPPDDEIKVGSLSFADYRKAFKQLYVGMGIITNRIARDDEKFVELSKLSDGDRMQLLGVLFGDYQTLNEYRLGSKGFGLKRKVRTHDEEWNVIEKIVDKDAGATEKEKTQIASRRGYREEFGNIKVEDETKYSVHAAGKISPEEMVRLRLEYPEIEADDFFRIVWSQRNPEEALKKQYSK